ncbi:copper oxidase [Pleomorphomonas diazotrophica]|uniref:Copper oxidase n=1 Tax=Pleomorphomonas diazotrophica TaxID=1166257 RepID=A0A1I4VD70_9HYPH|nr:multicopper oxidase family protein [Pleomorphomonas diazotrophica]PKR90007.1 copper oxidase [Pleomorphomonas diazotrophica]SFM99105.1 Multicopper oxidase with three cupredoxin domains (includes cell division protein FtsP and spore coat protein CotA) [Pleomorphomonas diazotrophica]
MNRRTLLKTALGGAAILSLPTLRAFAATTQTLTLASRTIEVNGRAATVYSLTGPDGKPGLTFDAGADFDVALANTLGEDTIVHWHGLTPPWDQDGVADAPKPMLKAGETRAYRFPVGSGGTHWMHAHTLQEQNLLAAPLIVRRPEETAADEQEIVILLHDFSFTSAAELLAKLKGNTSGGHAMSGMGHDMPAMDMSMQGMDHGGMDMGSMKGMDHGEAMDLNDIEYDAYLANDRTLDDPEVVKVEKGGNVRLRIINGATGTAFSIDLGSLEGQVIAVDGQPVQPVDARRFPMTMGQRLDIRLRVPQEGGAFPILALREGGTQRTGIVIGTAGSTVPKLSPVGEVAGPVVDIAQEVGLRAIAPLADRPADVRYVVDLKGDMAGYTWSMPGSEAIRVTKGQRVEIDMRNASMMAHPMHLHGHHFQVVGLDGGPRFSGAVRDTVLVPPNRTVTIAIDAENPGRWAFHCHHLYHMAAGMMGTFAYDDV